MRLVNADELRKEWATEEQDPENDEDIYGDYYTWAKMYNFFIIMYA